MSDVTLSDAERAAHVSDARRCMRLGMGVTYTTVRGLLRALDEAKARLSQEREQRDKAWREWAAGIAETAGGWREFDGLAYHEASAAQVLHKVRALLAEGPRLAQEGERA